MAIRPGLAVLVGRESADRSATNLTAGTASAIIS
jgi:hypothetical protein